MPPTVRQRALLRLFWTLSALLVLLTVGTAGYHLLEGMTFIDSLYMAVITVSTVGFGEIQPLSSYSRLFTMVLIVGGGGLAAYTLSSAAEFFLSGEWRLHLEEQRHKKQLLQLTNHTIVCGYGRMGRHVVDELKAERLPFVVIDQNAEKVERVQQHGDLAFEGNAANENDLQAVGIERAASLVAVASTDAENVFIVLTARSLRPDLVIVARANYDDSESKLLRAGANRVILPYRISGRRMVSLLVRPDVADFLDEVMHANRLELLLDQVALLPTSPLVGKTLGQAHLRSTFGVTILACRLPNNRINTSPTASTLLLADSHLIVLGTREQLEALMKVAQGTDALPDIAALDEEEE